MLDRIGDWIAAFSLAGAGVGWVIALIAGGVVLLCVLLSIRGGIVDARGLIARVAAALLAVLAGWWGFDYLARRDLADERRALDARAFELATRALAPGSALACLDALAGEAVEDACEKALFASPEATAVAVSYVSAQLSLLATATEHARRGGASSGITSLRRALEADRFGIVAHVLSVRDGCTPDQCGAFFLLRDASRISANIAERTFQSFIKTNMAGWPAAGARPVASIAPASTPAASAAPAAAAKVPNNLYFPSSSSIPPVNIMTAEPAAQAAQPPAQHDTTGEGATPTPPRRPGPSTAKGTAPSAAPPRVAPSPGNAAPSGAPAPLAIAPAPQ